MKINDLAMAKPQRWVMKMIVLTLAIMMVFVCDAFAIGINQIRVGDAYYVFQLFGDNKKVRVNDVDRYEHKVKIIYENGDEEWVNPDRLLTYLDAAKTTGSMYLVGAAIARKVYCKYFDDNNCKH